MKELTDAELMTQFSAGESEEAFTTLVNRHVHLVHSVALRHTADPQHAEEITQAVFLILARKAHSLSSNTILSGWLYHTARLTAANFQRSEWRRARREQEAFMRSTQENSTDESAWRELAPFLDEAMACLSAADRDAVVLRYFENKSLPEVGQALGLEHRAAQKRVSRAIEKLRRIFSRHGVTATVTLIAAAISSHSIQAAPLGLATKITATVLQGSVVAGTTLTLVKGTLHIMTCLKAKTAILIAATAVGVAVGVAAVHHHLSQAQPRHDAVQHKQDAEAAGGPAHVASDPTAQKLEDEQQARLAVPHSPPPPPPAGDQANAAPEHTQKIEDKQVVQHKIPYSSPPPPPAPGPQKQPLKQ